eukprot:2789082-Rhodomonas_salina.1
MCGTDWLYGAGACGTGAAAAGGAITLSCYAMCLHAPTFVDMGLGCAPRTRGTDQVRVVPAQRLMVEPVSESNTKDMALMKQHVLNALQVPSRLLSLPLCARGSQASALLFLVASVSWFARQ